MTDSKFMLLTVDDGRRQRNQFLVRVLIVSFVVILGFVIISLVISSDSPILKRPKFVHNCSKNYTYDFNLFTVRWPTTECSDINRCLPFKQNQWLIHGLWPTYASSGWPEYCCGHSFDTKSLSPIRDQLLTYWPNLIPGATEDSLWRHEWQKHGTCTKNQEIIYFNNTLNLLNKYPIYDWLKESNILPTNDNTYEVNTFQKVIDNKVGHKVVLHCVSHKQNSGTKAIAEIRICLNHKNESHEVIDCPEKSDCGQKLLYPTLHK
ncbi:ribonuclease Oy-like [Oppia nitens]|uniref:ribonuclease Oy-like n=1 Tax=Oppia nitens TaxID=1686743 RepID=UPI0023D9C330|nr:ribonuclease Oy-like [Oppia nitens]